MYGLVFWFSFSVRFSLLHTSIRPVCAREHAHTRSLHLSLCLFPSPPSSSPLFPLTPPRGLSVSRTLSLSRTLSPLHPLTLSFEMVQVAGSALALDSRGNSFTKYHLIVLLAHGGT